MRKIALSSKVKNLQKPAREPPFVPPRPDGDGTGLGGFAQLVEAAVNFLMGSLADGDAHFGLPFLENIQLIPLHPRV